MSNEGILIYSNDSWQDKYKIKLPPNLYCASSSQNISLQGVAINKGIGEVLPPNTKPRLSFQSFNIQGNVEVDSIKDVQEVRSSIMSELYGKPLYFFREADDDRFYISYLQGSVNVTYNQGYNIGRVFTISFNLISFEGISHSKKKHPVFLETLKVENGHKAGTKGASVGYFGYFPTFPEIIIQAKNDGFFKFNNTNLNNEFLPKEFSIIKIGKVPLCITNKKENNPNEMLSAKEIKRLHYKNGLLYILYNGKEEEELCKYVTEKSMSAPPFLESGPPNNFITIDLPINQSDYDNMEVIMTFREISF